MYICRNKTYCILYYLQSIDYERVVLCNVTSYKLVSVDVLEVRIASVSRVEE
jgi:hypothetical protein